MNEQHEKKLPDTQPQPDTQPEPQAELEKKEEQERRSDFGDTPPNPGRT